MENIDYKFIIALIIAVFFGLVTVFQGCEGAKKMDEINKTVRRIKDDKDYPKVSADIKTRVEIIEKASERVVKIW